MAEIIQVKQLTVNAARAGNSLCIKISDHQKKAALKRRNYTQPKRETQAD